MIRHLALPLAVSLLAACGTTETLPPPPRTLDLATARCATPHYPSAAARADVTGTTVVTFTVDAAGVVSNLAVARASGSTPEHALLDKSAVAFMKTCRFSEAPGFSPARAQRPVNWRLQ